MPTWSPAPLRYLSAADVRAAMPPLEDQLELAGRTMTALVADAELPPKIGVHPRPDGSFAHAMPALLRGLDPDGGDDRLGIKWVTGFGARNTARGIPAISAIVVLSDATTGVPIAILDGGPITAERTAAVSGVAIARFTPRVVGRAPRAAVIGAGVQAHSHLPVLGHLLPGVELAILGRDPGRAAVLAEAAAATAGIASVRVCADVLDATRDADVVVSAASFTSPERRQRLHAEAFAPQSLVVPVDYATMVAADVAATAALFLVDDRGQYLANRAAGQFDGYPEPGATIGEAMLAGTERPAAGRVVVTHLGVGLADVVFGEAILRRAIELGLGTALPG